MPITDFAGGNVQSCITKFVAETIPVMNELDSQWYWDRRNNKAYYPVEGDDSSITFVTVWHREEAADALENGALVPIDDLGPDYLENRDAGFDVFDSFRLPDEIEIDHTDLE